MDDDFLKTMMDDDKLWFWMCTTLCNSALLWNVQVATSFVWVVACVCVDLCVGWISCVVDDDDDDERSPSSEN